MISVRIKTVKPGELPYNRIGDWTWKGKQLIISVQRMKDWKHEFLIAMHELAEAFLCKSAGISEEEIDQFDKEHDGQWIPSGPGYKEHLTSTGIESIMAAISGVNWDQYEQAVNESSSKWD